MDFDVALNITPQDLRATYAFAILHTPRRRGEADSQRLVVDLRQRLRLAVRKLDETIASLRCASASRADAMQSTIKDSYCVQVA